MSATIEIAAPPSPPSMPFGSESRNPYFDILKYTSLGKVSPPRDVDDDKNETELITVTPDDPLRKAVKLMTDFKVRALPVISVSLSGAASTASAASASINVLGWVTILDVVRYVLKTADEKSAALTGDDFAGFTISGRDLGSVKISDIVGLDSSSVLCFHAGDSGLNAVEKFADGRAHRGLILDGKGVPLRTISQSDVVKFIEQHSTMHQLKQMATVPLSVCGFVGKPIVAIESGAPLIYALRTLLQTGTRALALVNETGDLVGNFSASDVKGLYHQFLPRMLQPVREYLATHSPRSLRPHVCLPSDTLGMLIQKLSSNLHHVWIVSEHSRVPSGIITLTDVMKIILNYRFYEENPTVLHVPGTLRMRIIRGLNLPATSPLSKASAFFSSLTGAVSPLNPGKLYAAVKFNGYRQWLTPLSGPPHNPMWDHTLEIPIRPFDREEHMVIKVKSGQYDADFADDSSLVGFHRFSMRWVLSAYGTDNPGLNYYKDEFNLKNSDGESVGSIEIEFQFEPKYMPWQHLMATRSIDDLPADYKSSAHVASTGSPAKQ